jgi:ribosomal protein S18 acetylase RimI-like enzyme
MSFSAVARSSSQGLSTQNGHGGTWRVSKILKLYEHLHKKKKESSMGRKEIVVREATDKDADGIIKVLMSTKLHEETWNGNKIFLTENLQKRLSNRQFMVLVAEFNSSIVGFIDCAVFPSFWECQKQGLIIDLFVHPAYQSKGVGSELLKALIERADAENIVELHVSTGRKNEKARKLYGKFGFKEERLLLERSQRPE